MVEELESNAQEQLKEIIPYCLNNFINSLGALSTISQSTENLFAITDGGEFLVCIKSTSLEVLKRKNICLQIITQR